VNVDLVTVEMSGDAPNREEIRGPREFSTVQHNCVFLGMVNMKKVIKNFIYAFCNTLVPIDVAAGFIELNSYLSPRLDKNEFIICTPIPGIKPYSIVNYCVLDVPHALRYQTGFFIGFEIGVLLFAGACYYAARHLDDHM